MIVSLSLFNGMAVGIEHMSGDEEDDEKYLIVIHLLCFRIVMTKYKDGVQ